ncbi:MAG: hypothetical protein EOP56_01055 [Sphingobacteriales bacterium]|nr:MAG: hypothetical protein EOP56_01055 [Sphingobacteriales bacterium]
MIVVLLLVRLHVIAGEPINIKGTSIPVITVTIAGEEAARIKGQLTEKAGSILGLYMIVDGARASVPVSGRYSLAGRKLSFEPIYPLGENMEFEVVWKSGDKDSTRRFNTSGQMTPVVADARVVTAYPTSDTIPYNTLFFHVRFSRPMMNDRQSYKYVQVYDDAGNEREKAWRQKSFWLDSGRVLVLMIHPGRVKNGIHYEGPLFDSGRYYKLVVNKDIKDANGNTLMDNYEQRFFVAGEDRVSPAAFIDNIHIPRAGSTLPLILSFSEGMDYASVIDGAKVYDGTGAIVPCSIESKPGDRRFAIVPDKQWGKGEYKLVLKSAVYDFAANRINRLFEITDSREMEKDKIEIKFSFKVD